MRVGSYRVDGRPAWGWVTADGEGLVDATSVHPTLKAALAAGGLGDLKRRLAGRPADRRVADTRFLPVVPDPDKVLCVGLNYDEHRKEGGNPEIGRASGRERVCQDG